MYNHAYINSFIFNKVTYKNYHHGNFSTGIKHNYIMHLKRGRARILFSEGSIDLFEGEIALIPKGTKYNTYLFGEPEIEFYSYAYLNYPGNIIKNFAPQKIEVNDKIENFSEELINSTESGCHTLGIFFFLLDELLKNVKTSHINRNKLILENAMNYMILNPSAKMSEVAKHANISESGLYLLFKNLSDTTPAKFKLQAKLERALNYILTTDLPIEEISSLCNFSSPSYFRKNFYKAYHKTPREMRKSNIAGNIL